MLQSSLTWISAKRPSSILRDKLKVDLLILLSEQELANNLRLAEAVPGIDVILSSDIQHSHPTAWERELGTAGPQGQLQLRVLLLSGGPDSD